MISDLTETNADVFIEPWRLGLWKEQILFTQTNQALRISPLQINLYRFASSNSDLKKAKIKAHVTNYYSHNIRTSIS